jgi:hypothetical protein
MTFPNTTMRLGSTPGCRLEMTGIRKASVTLPEDDDLRHGKNASACPFNRWNCTVVPRHAPFVKSKATTSS